MNLVGFTTEIYYVQTFNCKRMSFFYTFTAVYSDPATKDTVMALRPKINAGKGVPIVRHYSYIKLRNSERNGNRSLPGETYCSKAIL